MNRLFTAIKSGFDFIMSLVDALFNKHMLVRRFMVFWAMAIITLTAYVVIPKLEAGHALAGLTAIIGLLTTVIAFYQWHRNQDK